MNKLKLKVTELLSRKDKTIPQLCMECEINDEFRMVSLIAELEIEGKVQLKGWSKFYEPNGRVGFLAKYGCVKTSACPK